ncbi:MAG TPA: methyltransferase domain-containing protein [Gemmataceae bacterium]|nr:methyltransferase domain-containing protein [Gemmataceae bacterium]
MRTVLGPFAPFPIRQWGRQLFGLPTAEQDVAARAAIMQAAVPYAIQITHHYLTCWIPGAPASLRGIRILELGPGRDFTPALILAGYGADVTLADLYLERWDPHYHPAFYRAVRDEVRRSRPEWPLDALDEVIARGDHWAGPIRTLRRSLERLSGIPDDSFDLTISNAVFEHLYDVPQALRELYRVTRPGGIGIHQIDYRDHNNYSRPLEFLTLPRYKLGRDREATRRGNRFRHHEFADMFRSAGFEIAELHPDAEADPEYLADVLPRLAPPYSAMSLGQLKPLGCRFHLSGQRKSPV